MPKTSGQRGWRGPTIQEVAKLSGVGSATVDRVLNNRPGVREKTRQRVNAALEKLRRETEAPTRLRIALCCESGASFNRMMEEAVDTVHRTVPAVEVHDSYVVTHELDPAGFSSDLLQAGQEADGAIVVAREHPAINGAIRQLRRAGKPVVCLTTDLPSSRRSAYVGNDQHAAGSAAAQLIGQALCGDGESILLVMSVAFRCQREREMGFRRVLRARFPQLRIEERVMSDDMPETVCSQLREYFAVNGVPNAIYNVAGANRGVAQALEESGQATETVFVGHELTPTSRELLARGTMDYVVSHDMTAELTQAVWWIEGFGTRVTGDPPPTQILLHTRYNCGL